MTISVQNNNTIGEWKYLFSMNTDPTSTLTAPVRSVVVIGENEDVDTGTVPEWITDIGGVITLPTCATTASLVSTSCADTLGGTGANIILLEGLDACYNEQWEVINLNGLCAVTSANTYLRINAVRVVFSGSGKKNAGVIDVTVDCNIISRVNTGESFAHTAIYTVPAKHTYFLTNTSFGIVRGNGTAFATIGTNVFVPCTNTIVESNLQVVDGDQSRGTNHLIAFPRIPEKSDIYWTVESTTANNTNVFMSARGLLVHNDWIPSLQR